MPQLESTHILYDIFLLTSISFFGFLVICYSTCNSAINYYNSINKYIVNLNLSLFYYIKY